MLDKEQTKQIPKTTRAYWDEKYIGQFDQIKEVVVCCDQFYYKLF